jgi:hypothetical protein
MPGTHLCTGGRLDCCCMNTTTLFSSCTLLLWCGLIAPQQPLNIMAGTRSIVATLVILVGAAQLAAATKVCYVCENIPADCLDGNGCPEISVAAAYLTPGQVNVARHVCVAQGDLSTPFNIACGNSTASGTTIDVATRTCASTTYLYSVAASGVRFMMRALKSAPGLSGCGAQRHFCAPPTAAPGPAVIDTSVTPWQIRSGAFSCTLTMGFASNKWQLSCL